MLFVLPWIFFGIAVIAFLLLADDYRREALYREHMKEVAEINMEKERLMSIEECGYKETEYYISA